MIDDSSFDSKRVAAGWTVDDEPWFYASQTGALSLNENILTVIAQPGGQVGDSAVVTTSPLTDYVRIVNCATTGRRGTKETLTFDRVRGKNELVIAGSLPLKHDRIVKFMTVEDPGLYTGYILRDVLGSAGVLVHGHVKRKDAKRDVRRPSLLIRDRSATLARIVHSLNKTSDNFYAEQLLKMIGTARRNDGSWAGGLKAVQTFLKQIGIRRPYRIVDGSGLSRYNLVCPEVITTVLRAMRRTKCFVDSLPVTGEDNGYGTLRKRMKGSRAANNLRAKTGTLEGVSTLSGYVKSLDGEVLVFSIMTNQAVGDHSLEKRFQDSVGVALAANEVKEIPEALQGICDL